MSAIDGRHRSWAQLQLRERRRSFLELARQWLILWVAFSTVVGGGVFLVFSWAFPAPVKWVFLGAYPVAIAWSVAWMRGWDGTRSLRNGISAERQTARLLASFRRGGWCCVNNLDMGGYDIDHLLVGPSGVLLFETKYRGDLKELSEAYLRRHEGRALSDVARYAATVQGQLPRSGVTWVQPVLILWGPTSGSIEPSHVKIGPVVVGSGPRAEEWLPALLAGTGRRVDVESVMDELEVA
ncbi:MAG: NERD domain-containing protein [Acidimicrobiia bacterium]|nr:NERD domain-containing protein [Acidimicrobiia bacterium]